MEKSVPFLQDTNFKVVLSAYLDLLTLAMENNRVHLLHNLIHFHIAPIYLKQMIQVA